MHRLRNSGVILAWMVIGLIALSMISCNHQPELARLTVFVSGYTQGYYKNCGCSSGQAGGEMRKIALLNKQVAEAIAPLPADDGLPSEILLLEIGNFLDYSTEVQRIYSECVMETTAAQNYQLVGLGRNELAYPQAELWELLKDHELNLVASNLEFVTPEVGDDRSAELNALLKAYTVHEYANGYRIGIIHVLDDAAIDNLGPQTGCILGSAVESAQEVVAAHQKEANFWVLSVGSANREGTPPEAIAAIDGIDVVVGYMTDNPIIAADGTKAAWPYFIRRPYRKSKDLVEASFQMQTSTGNPVVTSQRIRIPDSIDADPLAADCYKRIKAKLEELEYQRWEELSDKEAIPPVYIGFNQCFACHEEAWDIFMGSKHATAYEELVAQDQHGSAACLPCHVLGYGERTGWNKIENKEYWRGVSCESCHGPGQYHQDLMQATLYGEPYDPPEDLSADGRNELGLQPVGEGTCLKCHDEENSIEFEFNVYWPKIMH